MTLVHIFICFLVLNSSFGHKNNTEGQIIVLRNININKYYQKTKKLSYSQPLNL